jgi:predicted GIY-YIG superfamily endonuclease
MTALEQFMNDSDEYSKPTQYKDHMTVKPDEERELIEVAPDWWRRACKADDLYYVGYTDNLGTRLYDHILGTDAAALFTKVFEPNALLSVREYDTQELALEREKQIARTLNDFENFKLHYTDYHNLPIPTTQLQNKWDRYYGNEIREKFKFPETIKEEKQRLFDIFEDSEFNCLIDFLLDLKIKSAESHLDSLSYDKRQDIIYYKIVRRHLKNCQRLVDQQKENSDCVCEDDIDKSIDRIRDFYRGAYLDYRGLIRRMNSEKLVYAYQN